MVARVILEIALWKDFDYLIPSELEGLVSIGSRVRVPFGGRIVYGFVTEIVEKSSVSKLKPILGVVGKRSPITSSVLRLARWVAEYYCCSPEIALKSIIPKSVRREKEGWLEQMYVRVSSSGKGDFKLSRRQMEILAIIEEHGEISLARLIKLANTTSSTIRRLEDKGIIEISLQRVERDPYEDEIILPTKPLTLNSAQEEAFNRIAAAINDDYSKVIPGTGISGASNGVKPAPVFLLHGVTGSGKTEVYLQAIACALKRGKGAIVLVPEISLTPQTVERFKARFSQGELKTSVAVLHSHLSDGERHDQWHRVRDGRAKIVIGARSAIFAPVEPLGLIIVDEEHEQSYKQEDMPCYNARDVAVVRGQMEGAVVVLGSATPSLESYYNARRGKYIFLKLPERVDNKKMPNIRVVDLRSAGYPERGVPIFSPQLKEAILQRLERREQVILFLNRRGHSTHLQCPRCGYVAKCVNCSVAMTYHRQYEKLLCHICGNEEQVPRNCPDEKCRAPEIRFGGFGTQRIEEILKKHFPEAIVARMDSDTMQKKDDYRKILNDFRSGKIDIIVGTQMIAKGLHFPRVTLVGIIYADIALQIPDFRAGERAFQLITQVAGRAGRGDVEGEVIVQSFTPYHPAIQFARRHDYDGFFEEELRFRMQLRYPPVSRAALLTFRGRNEEKVKVFANYFKEQMFKAWRIRNDDRMNGTSIRGDYRDYQTANNLPLFDDLIVSGPAPAAILKAHSYYRYQIMLRTKRIARLGQEILKLTNTIKPIEGVLLKIDIDPVSIV